MIRLVRLGIVVLFCFVILVSVLPGSFEPVTALGPDSCTSLIQNSLAAVKPACATTGTNSVCYGNDAVQAKLIDPPNVTAPVFGTKGNTVDLTTVQSLTTSLADTTKGLWGIAVVNIHADLPDDSKGVTGVLFGDATIASDVHSDAAKLTTLPVKTIDADPVLLRSAANANDPAYEKLTAGQDAAADGRTTDSRWIRVRIAKGGLGWAAASQVKVTGDISTLTVLDAHDTAPYYLYTEPMQAFTLTTGKPSATCTDASAGLLLQSSDKQVVHFLVDHVDIGFAQATVLLHAVAKDSLEADVIAGTITVKFLGSEVMLNSGDAVQVRLSGKDGLTPSAAPKAKTTYAFAKVQNLPTDVLPDPLPCTLGLMAKDKSVAARSGPGTQAYGSLFYLNPAQVYTVSGWAAATDGAPWWKLTTSKQEGWVDKATVHVIGACEQVAKVEPAAPVAIATGSGPASVSTPGTTVGAATFAPTAKTIWNAIPSSDTQQGQCGIGALNYCSLLVAITPQGSGMLWKGQEIKPFFLGHIKDNLFSGGGRNGAGDGTLVITVNFTSPSTFTASQILVLDADPTCKHIHAFTGTLR